MAHSVSLPSSGPYLGGGFRVADATVPPWLRIAQGTWDPYVFELLDALLHRTTDDEAGDSTASALIDVGAFVGPLSLYAVSSGAAHVFAVEADAENFALLSANLRANPPAFQQRVTAHLLCVSNESGLREFGRPVDDAEDMTISATVGPSATAMLADVASSSTKTAGGGGRLVPCVPLSLYWREATAWLRTSGTSRRAPVLSLDIEGAEALALADCRDDLASLRPELRPPLILELHPGFFAAGAARAAYVGAIMPTLALYPHLYFLGRESQPRCGDVGPADADAGGEASSAPAAAAASSLRSCHWPALLHEFPSAEHLGSFLLSTTEVAFMLHAATRPPQMRRSTPTPAVPVPRDSADGTGAADGSRGAEPEAQRELRRQAAG